MQLALSLAHKGLGQTSPNPMVGAVLVKDGEIIGEGYHKRVGLAHAEIEALDKAKEKARGATLYVTLEPCAHWGKTPPCTDALIEAGIKQVIFAMRDPNPLVNGKGITQLQQAGIQVTGALMEEEAKKLNEVFIHVMKHKLPFVTVKVAQSLDGKIATDIGESRWITGEAARCYVHFLREQVDAILVGIQTVLKDDPSLTVRIGKRKSSKQPKRIILDPQLRISPKARIFKTGPPKSQLIVTSLSCVKTSKAERLKKLTTCEILGCRLKNGRFQLRSLLKQLAKESLHHLLVEGGGQTIATFLEQKLVNKVVWFVAPIIIGGRQAPTSVAGRGIKKLSQAIRLKEVKVTQLGPDICIEGQLK